MRPVPSLVRCLAPAMLLPLAASCAKLPPSPVPAALSEREAEAVARDYLVAQGVEDISLYSIRPGDEGYLVAYQSRFDEDELPPKFWRLIDVRHDGAVRELEWRKNR